MRSSRIRRDQDEGELQEREVTRSACHGCSVVPRPLSARMIDAGSRTYRSHKNDGDHWTG